MKNDKYTNLYTGHINNWTGESLKAFTSTGEIIVPVDKPARYGIGDISNVKIIDTKTGETISEFESMSVGYHGSEKKRVKGEVKLTKNQVIIMNTKSWELIQKNALELSDRSNDPMMGFNYIMGLNIIVDDNVKDGTFELWEKDVYLAFKQLKEQDDEDDME